MNKHTPEPWELGEPHSGERYLIMPMRISEEQES